MANGSRMNAGKVMFIPANEEHQMSNTGKELLVVVCLVPAKAPGIVGAPPGHREGKDPNPSRLPITPGIPISHEGYVQSHDQAAHQGPQPKKPCSRIASQLSPFPVPVRGEPGFALKLAAQAIGHQPAQSGPATGDKGLFLILHLIGFDG